MMFERFVRDTERIERMHDYKHNLMKRRALRRVYRLLLNMDDEDEDFKDWIAVNLIYTRNQLRMLLAKRCMYNRFR